MPKPKGTHHVISASETDTGAPLYLAVGGHFSPKLSDALPISNEEERDQLLSDALGREREISDPYTFMVVLEDGVPVALSARELIRATGPTTVMRRPDR